MQASGQYVVFRLAGREYGLPIEQVMEVIRMAALAPLPGAPDWLQGVLNLRGKAVPVMDLRRRLGLPALPVGLHTPIILARTRERPVGLIADEALDVLVLGDGAMEPPDPLAGDDHAVAAIGRSGDRLVMVFDLDRLCGDALRHV